MSAEISDPPHITENPVRPALPRITAQGHAPCGAYSPPTILMFPFTMRVFTPAMPHPSLGDWVVVVVVVVVVVDVVVVVVVDVDVDFVVVTVVVVVVVLVVVDVVVEVVVLVDVELAVLPLVTFLVSAQHSVKSWPSKPQGFSIALTKYFNSRELIPSLKIALRIGRHCLAVMYWHVPASPRGVLQPSLVLENV